MGQGHEHHSYNIITDTIDLHDKANARRIRQVVMIGCVANILLMILKLGFGYYGKSDALVADGFHSLNDIGADLLMFLFVGVSFRKADRKFSYGYGKFETFASFLISILLLFVAGMIIGEAVEKFIAYSEGEVLARPNIITLIAVIIAMMGKECLFRFYKKEGRKTDCRALVASAWHHRSDAFASIAALVGITFSYFLGEKWRILDPVASCIIAIFIFIPAIHNILIPSFLELTEHSAGKQINEKIRRIILSFPEVEGINVIKTRRVGPSLIIDLSLIVEKSKEISTCYQLTSGIRQKLKDEFGSHTDVSVAFIPSGV